MNWSFDRCGYSDLTCILSLGGLNFSFLWFKWLSFLIFCVSRLCLSSRLFLIWSLWGECLCGWDNNPNAQPPTWRNSGLLFVWPLPFDMCGLGDLARSFISRLLRYSGHGGVRKPPHHEKVAFHRGGGCHYSLYNVILVSVVTLL